MEVGTQHTRPVAGFVKQRFCGALRKLTEWTIRLVSGTVANKLGVLGVQVCPQNPDLWKTPGKFTGRDQQARSLERAGSTRGAYPTIGGVYKVGWAFPACYCFVHLR